MKDAGVIGVFSVTDEAPTASCAALIAGHQRTLCAHLGAATKFPFYYLDSNISYLEKASYIYSTGFFLDSNYSAFDRACTFALENNKPFGFNLSALYVIGQYMKEIERAINFADFVFCNEDEASAYAKALGLKSEHHVGLAQRIAKMPKANKKRPERVVIITEGSRPTIVVKANT